MIREWLLRSKHENSEVHYNSLNDELSALKAMKFKASLTWQKTPTLDARIRACEAELKDAYATRERLAEEVRLAKARRGRAEAAYGLLRVVGLVVGGLALWSLW